MVLYRVERAPAPAERPGLHRTRAPCCGLAVREVVAVHNYTAVQHGAWGFLTGLACDREAASHNQSIPMARSNVVSNSCQSVVASMRGRRCKDRLKRLVQISCAIQLLCMQPTHVQAHTVFVLVLGAVHEMDRPVTGKRFQQYDSRV